MLRIAGLLFGLCLPAAAACPDVARGRHFLAASDPGTADSRAGRGDRNRVHRIAASAATRATTSNLRFAVLRAVVRASPSADFAPKRRCERRSARAVPAARATRIARGDHGAAGSRGGPTRRRSLPAGPGTSRNPSFTGRGIGRQSASPAAPTARGEPFDAGRGGARKGGLTAADRGGTRRRGGGLVFRVGPGPVSVVPRPVSRPATAAPVCRA